MTIFNVLIYLITCQLGQPGNEEFFEYVSKGTYSRMEIHVDVYTDKKVSYKRSHLKSGKVFEQWTGIIEEADYNAFVQDVIETCKFMKLPDSIQDPVNIKDLSTEQIVVNYNSKTHSIGGYGASQYKKYEGVYKSYHKMMLCVKEKKYKVKQK